MNPVRRLISLMFLLSLMGPAGVYAQEDGVVTPTEEEVLDAANKPTTKGYINLSVGVYYDEKLEDAPRDIEIDGTFRKYTKMQWNPDTRTLRFNPRNPGVGTLIIKHLRPAKSLWNTRSTCARPTCKRSRAKCRLCFRASKAFKLRS